MLKILSSYFISTEDFSEFKRPITDREFKYTLILISVALSLFTTIVHVFGK